MIDQHTRVVLGQLAVDGKISEINRFAPLLDAVIGIATPTLLVRPARKCRSHFVW